MSNNDNLPIIFAKKYGKEFTVKSSHMYEMMKKELDGIEDFGERLAIIVDTIDNIFRLQKGEKLLTYDQYRLLRKKKSYIIKHVKRIKRCKKSKRR